MKKMLLLILFLPSTIFAQADTSPKDIIINKLKALEGKYYSYLSFDERREAISLMNEIINMVDPKLLGESTPLNQYNLLSDNVFNILLENVTSTSDVDSQIRMILVTVSKGYITSNQLEMIIKQIGRDDKKTELIKGIYSQIIDPINMIIVTQHYSSRIDRGRMEQWLIEQ